MLQNLIGCKRGAHKESPQMPLALRDEGPDSECPLSGRLRASSSPVPGSHENIREVKALPSGLHGKSFSTSQHVPTVLHATSISTYTWALDMALRISTHVKVYKDLGHADGTDRPRHNIFVRPQMAGICQNENPWTMVYVTAKVAATEPF